MKDAQEKKDQPPEQVVQDKGSVIDAESRVKEKNKA
jgi:hypothetical protein